MELVEGAPLAGPLPMAQAVAYAGQILDALDAAHRKGITHRDLKPANILVTRHGIKLLDFGLAKRTGGPLGDAAQTMSALTTEGQIVGTLQYMAPEQLQNQPVDARADLFAFGCVLYELLAGRRAFEGNSPASVIAAILERQPAPLAIHPPLDRVIATCLAKNPDERFQTALDTKRAMQWAMEQPSASAMNAAPTSRPRERLLMAVAAMALVALGAVSYRWYPRPSPPPESIAFTIAPPPGQQLVGASFLSVSPDGRQIAYVTGNGQELWVRTLGALESKRFEHADYPWSPTWSPDSRSIAFTRRYASFTRGFGRSTSRRARSAPWHRTPRPVVRPGARPASSLQFQRHGRVFGFRIGRARVCQRRAQHRDHPSPADQPFRRVSPADWRERAVPRGQPVP